MTLISLYSQWANFDMFILLLAAQFYFPWPMHEFINGVGALTLRQMKKTLTKLGKRIFAKYKELRVLDGRLIKHVSRGIQSTKNPSERNNGSVRFLKLLEDLDGSLDLCAKMKLYFNSCKRGIVSLGSMLQVLDDSTSNCFSSQLTYKNVRCCRLLALASGKQFENTLGDWKLWSGMSPHISTVLRSLGVQDWKVVEKFLVAFSELVNSPYSISDFIIYVCLLRNVSLDE